MNRNRPQRHAFTLIELLVVVTIIIALLAILMPSMNRALKATERAICASNIHQLCVATLSYAADSFGAVPADNTKGNGSWMWDLTHNVTGMLVDHAGPGDDKLDIFYDPANAAQNADTHWVFTPDFRVCGYWFTYARVRDRMHNWGGGQLTSGHPWIARIGQASPNYSGRLMIVTDATISANGNFNEVWGGSPIAHATSDHDNSFTQTPAGGNVGYLDGGVTWKPFDDMVIQFGGPDHWF